MSVSHWHRNSVGDSRGEKGRGREREGGEGGVCKREREKGDVSWLVSLPCTEIEGQGDCQTTNGVCSSIDNCHRPH